MREAQAFATNTGHLLAMYSAATRPGVYAAIDERLKARLSPAQYARYEAESQRPVFQRQVYAATLAGADLDQVLDTATGQDFTGARSIAAVMHGRLKAARLGEAPEAANTGRPYRGRSGSPKWSGPRTAPWAWSWPRPSTPRRPGWPGTRPNGPSPGSSTRSAPTPWTGPPALQADWLARVGTAAGYRQAAGITDPNMVVGPAPQAHPELLTWHARRGGSPGDPHRGRMIWAMTPGPARGHGGGVRP